MSEALPDRVRQRPSMADVGQRASVSAQTVSRYFTGGYVGRSTRERIELAISELGYVHNQVARNLRVQRSETVGFMAMGPLNLGHTELLTGVSHAARAEGLSVLTSITDIDPDDRLSHNDFRRAMESLLSYQVDGIVLATPYLRLDEAVEQVGHSVPIVVLAEQLGDEVDSTHLDSFGAGYLATRHLLDLGHTHILHLAGPGDRVEAIERERGYRAALTEARIPYSQVLGRDEWDARSGAACGRSVDLDSFTGVFAANDDIALGFMQAMTDRGRTAPLDYSIVGVDDMPNTAYFAPPLTTVNLDFRALGERALQMLAERIRTGERQGGQVVDARLVVRRSTRAL